MTENKFVSEARAWIGTPYRHQASAKGVGCDCLGLIRGVWRNTVGPEPEITPAYTPDWTEVSGDETLFRAASRHFNPVEIDLGAAGDVLLFRMKDRFVAKHLGILSGTQKHPKMIHAISGREVAEITLGPEWQKKIVGQFAFPERSK